MKSKGIQLHDNMQGVKVSVIRGEDGKIVQGLTLGDVTAQNIHTLLHLQPGELKMHPTVGVGIAELLLSHDTLLYKHRIRQQLSADGLRVVGVEVDNNNIRINASYD